MLKSSIHKKHSIFFLSFADVFVFHQTDTV